MKKTLTILFTVLISIILLITIYVKINSNFYQSTSFLSPLPDFLTIFQNHQVSTMNLWLPLLEEDSSNLKKPDITAEAALLYDLKSKKTLYSRNAERKLPMASLTKIMTAIIALENPKKDDKYIVREEDIVGESMMGLEKGEVLSLDELLYGLILNSANDAAEVIANNYKDGRIAFVEAMNDKAKALGLKNTNFTNPSGLEGDGDQYSTAYDLLVITNYALQKLPTFKKVVSTVEYRIKKSIYHKEYYLVNETNLLTSYPGVKGVKTGYTNEAGLCLITYLDYKDHGIIGILLNSQSRREEMKELLDYSLNVQGITPPKHS